MRLSARMLHFTAFALPLIVALMFWGCGPQELNSFWLSLPPESSEPDWLNLTSYKVDKLGGTVTLTNDSSAFYIRMTSSDRRLAGRLQGRGLTVWLADAKDKDHRLGIHYPIGMRDSTRHHQHENLLPDASLPPEALEGMMNLPAEQDLEIISSDSTLQGRKSPAEAETLGVHANLTVSTGIVVYTLRVAMLPAFTWLRPGADLLFTVDSPAGQAREHRGQGGNHAGHGGGEGGWGGQGGGGGFGGRHGGYRGEGGDEGAGGNVLSANQDSHPMNRSISNSMSNLPQSHPPVNRLVAKRIHDG